MLSYAIYGLPELEPLRAFAEGLQSLDRRIYWRNHNAYAGEVERFDAVVVYGGRPPGDLISERYTAAGKPVVVIDHGYLKRVHRVTDYSHGHFQVGMRRLGWVPNAAPSYRREALGVAAKARQARRVRRILVCGQVAADAQHGLGEAAMIDAYSRLGASIRAGGGRPFFRRHPFFQSIGDPDIEQAPGADSPLSEVLTEFDAVAALNSNAGLEALIEGVPAITTMRSHYDELAYRWPIRLGAIEAPPPARINALLDRIAYAQWTAEEMRRGQPQRYLMELGEIP